jgi:sugar O-acyltransferase (sialic acid O-acetyltransferase NeuD family)
MNKLLILGAGGFGREVLDWASVVPESQRDWEIAGFLDDRPNALDGLNCRCQILGSAGTYDFGSEDRVVCAIGDPKVRLQNCRELKTRGVQFVSIIHPTAIIGSNSRIGEGCILCPYSIITANVTVGNFVVINLHSSVGHDAIIGDGCTFSAHVDVTGGVTLGEGVFLGSHASVTPRIKIADYTVVGAGSVILKKTKPGVTMFGVPAIEM